MIKKKPLVFETDIIRKRKKRKGKWRTRSELHKQLEETLKANRELTSILRKTVSETQQQSLEIIKLIKQVRKIKVRLIK